MAIPTPPRSPSPTPNPVRICVTGAAGLVGSQLCQYLLSVGHSVVALDIVPTDSPKLAIRPESTKRYKYIVGSAEDYEIYRDACRGCDGIVHLAAVYTRPERPRVHNANVAMSYNTLSIAVELGINRVAMASSCTRNGQSTTIYRWMRAILVVRKTPILFCELQSESFVRRFPSLRIATLRFHAVVPMSHVSPSSLNALGGAWKDLWGWVSNLAVARSCLLSLTAPTETFPEGTHEAFFIVAPTICQQKKTQELLEGMYPEWKSDEMKIHLRRPFTSNEGLFDCSKAERMLGWRENGYYMET
ncbi:uncharacterized protein L203_100839 [Cryptococcus depauperatus CBS 7841]|uniref:NAD-dependent epimerase/dehydratase domain-containing protein n=1 Tax=Cryptococcus depauperatus CBS 7841 TaxID=1295531 RepID=A0AAJ8LWV1_9TREE